MVIPLRRQLLDASSNQPGNLGRAALKRPPIWFCSRWGLPGSRCHHRDGELLPRLFTLITPEADGIFSVALSLGSPPVRVTDHLALWSSDFPLIPSLCRRGRATILPTLTIFINWPDDCFTIKITQSTNLFNKIHCQMWFRANTVHLR
jgi:hypothetical protein